MFFNRSGKNVKEPDARLIDKFHATGDIEYLGILYERYMHLVYGVCLKYFRDREASRDAVMQIFEKLIIELPKRKVENFKPWLHVITRNHCLMQLRSEKSRSARTEKMIKEHGLFMESSYVMHHNNEDVLKKDVDALKKCIEQLKKEQRECVKLFYLEEKCYQEVADALDVELKKVKSHIQNGKRNLKLCLERNG